MKSQILPALRMFVALTLLFFAAADLLDDPGIEHGSLLAGDRVYGISMQRMRHPIR